MFVPQPVQDTVAEEPCVANNFVKIYFNEQAVKNQIGGAETVNLKTYEQYRMSQLQEWQVEEENQEELLKPKRRNITSTTLADIPTQRNTKDLEVYLDSILDLDRKEIHSCYPRRHKTTTIIPLLESMDTGAGD